MANVTSLLSQALTRSLPSTSSESDNEFLDRCRATTLLAELEDEEDLPEPDEDDDENEDENEDDDDYEDVMVCNQNIWCVIKIFERFHGQFCEYFSYHCHCHSSRQRHSADISKSFPHISAAACLKMAKKYFCAMTGRGGAGCPWPQVLGWWFRAETPVFCTYPSLRSQTRPHQCKPNTGLWDTSTG